MCVPDGCCVKKHDKTGWNKDNFFVGSNMASLWLVLVDKIDGMLTNYLLRGLGCGHPAMAACSVH